MPEYRLLTKSDQAELESTITQTMRDGWSPQGAVSVTGYGFPKRLHGGEEETMILWAQAMVRDLANAPQPPLRLSDADRAHILTALQESRSIVADPSNAAGAGEEGR